MKFELCRDEIFGEYFVLPSSCRGSLGVEGGDGGAGGGGGGGGAVGTLGKATFLHTEMDVTPLKTGSFHSDLTPRDDILIAILSLLLLLVIHALLTSILLRTTTSGAVSTFAFSVAQFFELVRDFRHAAFRTGKARSGERARLNLKLAVVALCVVSFSFGLEVLVLFLSEPDYEVVTNHDASFSLRQPSFPSWKAVRRAMGEGEDEEDRDESSAGFVSPSPCRVLRLNGVEQRKTRVMTCLTTSLFAMGTRRFEKVEDEDGTEELVIETLLHEYGANHFVKVGEVSGNFSARAYLSLGGGRRRVIAERNINVASDKQVKKLHNVLVGLIASGYNIDTGRKRFTVESLKKVKVEFEAGVGPDVSIVKLKSEERYHRVVSQRYVSRVKMPAVGGLPTLGLVGVAFKGATSVAAEERPNDADLMMNTGNRQQYEEVMWYEKQRGINWLTLCVLLSASMVTLIVIRYAFKPVSTTELAAAVVHNCVGADGGRSPLQMEGEERNVFTTEMLENWNVVGDDWDEDMKRGRFHFTYR